jgi:hypothetical protein
MEVAGVDMHLLHARGASEARKPRLTDEVRARMAFLAMYWPTDFEQHV